MEGTKKLELSEAFARVNSDGLGDRLTRAGTLEEAGLIAQEIVAKLSDPAGPAIGELQRRYGEQVRALLGLVSRAAEMVRASSETKTEKVQLAKPTKNERLATAGATVATAGVLVLATPATLGAAAFAVAGVLVASEGIRHLEGGLGANSVDISVTRAKPENVLAGLRDMLEQIQIYADRWILTPTTVEKPLRENDDLIELLHSLLRADDAQVYMPAPWVAKVVNFLTRQGIEVLRYDPTRDGATPDPTLWSVDAASNATVLTTVLPVLRAQGRVIRKGYLVQQ